MALVLKMQIEIVGATLLFDREVLRGSRNLFEIHDMCAGVFVEGCECARCQSAHINRRKLSIHNCDAANRLSIRNRQSIRLVPLSGNLCHMIRTYDGKEGQPAHALIVYRLYQPVMRWRPEQSR